MTEQFSQYQPSNASAEPNEDIWRNEVQDRLARYKRRRGRRIEGAFTMRFPFPADEAAELSPTPETTVAVAELSPDVNLDTVEASQSAESFDALDIDPPASEAITQDAEVAEDAIDLVLESPAVPEPEPEPFVDTVVRPRPKRKVIAFPKQLSVVPEQQMYRLADPVNSEVPRILDVPEELQAIPTTPFLDGLQFEPSSATTEARDVEHVELPFRAAQTSQRVLAAAIDGAVVAVCVVVFAVVAYKILANPPLTKPLVLGLVAATVVLWSAYQYLFVVHAGTTLGMLAARIRIRTFRGKSPTLRQRRHRVLGFYLSALSLGMGLMWAFVDVDGLCWHDRLSRTCLSERE